MPAMWCWRRPAAGIALAGQTARWTRAWLSIQALCCSIILPKMRVVNSEGASEHAAVEKSHGLRHRACDAGRVQHCFGCARLGTNGTDRAQGVLVLGAEAARAAALQGSQQ